jgi:glutamate-5-semialdehyde dehydrogenase
MSDHIDVVIPRGGKSLITAISNNSKIPLFKHLDGNCHIYVHSDADFAKATKIIINAKLRRTGICGAAESLLIDAKIADSFLPLICKDLQNQNCEIRGDEICQQINNSIKPACEQDYYQEYLDKIISIKVVKNIDQAMEWIEKYGSAHTDSIITENQLAAQQFLQQVDSAIVMHNTSTQFADGGEFGLGAEVGISTGRMHARGPVGLEQLTIYKYIVSAECGLR